MAHFFRLQFHYFPHTGHCFFLCRDPATQTEGFYPKSRMQTHFWRKALSAHTSSTEGWNLTSHLAVTKHPVASGLSKACSCLLSYHFKLLCSSETEQETSFFPIPLAQQCCWTDTSASLTLQDEQSALNCSRQPGECTGHKHKLQIHTKMLQNSPDNKQLCWSSTTKLLSFLRLRLV